jgi:hypothetical protein
MWWYTRSIFTCKRLLDTIHDAFTIIFWYYAFCVSLYAALHRVRRTEISMHLTGLHCLAMLRLIISYIEEYIIQVICNGN